MCAELPAVPSLTELRNARLALTPVYPTEFEADVVAGTLPKVSWIMPPIANCEHPATPPEYGEYLVSQILEALVKNPEVWASTVFLVLYDENGGFFDHVAPPTPGPTVTTLADLPAGVEPGGNLDRRVPRGHGRDQRRRRSPVRLAQRPRTGGPRVSGTGAGHLALQRRRMGVPRRLRPHLDTQAHRESVPGPGCAARFRRPAHLEVALRPCRGPHQCSPKTEHPCHGSAIAPVHLHGRPDRRGAKCAPRLRRHGRLRPRVPGTGQQQIRPEAGRSRPHSGGSDPSRDPDQQLSGRSHRGIRPRNPPPKPFRSGHPRHTRVPRLLGLQGILRVCMFRCPDIPAGPSTLPVVR